MLPVVVSVRSSDELEDSLPFKKIVIDAREAPLDQLVMLLQLYPSTEFFVHLGDEPSEVALQVLDAGALGVAVPYKQVVQLMDYGIPGNRLIASCTMDEATAIIEEGGVLAVSVQYNNNPEQIKALEKQSAALVQKHGYYLQVYCENVGSDYALIAPVIPVIHGADLTNDAAANPSKIPLVDVICSQLSSDRPDGLYLTVVTNEHQRVLGTVYSSRESISESLRTSTGVYQSRKRGLWYKGASSGATQRLISVSLDCDGDALQFVVEQNAPGFCHNNTLSCFGPSYGLEKLQETVQDRKVNAPKGSYTERLFSDPTLLNSKLMEEAEEVCDATTPSEIAWEAADLLYFLSVKMAQHGVSLKDVEANLEAKSRKISRRKGDGKAKWDAVALAKAGAGAVTGAVAGVAGGEAASASASQPPSDASAPVAVAPAPAAVAHAAAAAPAAATATPTSVPTPVEPSAPIAMTLIDGANKAAVAAALRRPAQSSNAFELAKPIVDRVKAEGDAALLDLTAKFDKVQLASPVLQAPFSEELMVMDPEVKRAIDLACSNVSKFHAAQLTDDLTVETTPGVVCSRFSRPIARVGLYVPGGSAVLPSTAIMLGVPASVAGVREIVIASPPRADGTPTPEVVYVAHKVGAKQIVLAGGAQAVAAMAYGTSSVTKVDKILGPGNQFVTAAKMLVQTDLNAQVSIDMPAGPSEVLVVADQAADKSFVVSDLLSQAEHGPDSQVILIAVQYTQRDIDELQAELDAQARALPRFEVIRKSIGHSSILTVDSVEQALELSNQYAPEHLILQIESARTYLPLVQNAGSVFVGALSPESCGDYTSGTNHTLPTYGYANQYSGVNTSTYLKHITSQELTPEGMRAIGPATVALARCEGLDAHANACVVRLAKMGYNL